MTTHELLRSIQSMLELPHGNIDWSDIIAAIDVELAKPEGEWQPTIESIDSAYCAGMTTAAAICRDRKLFPRGGAGVDYAQAIEKSRDGDQHVSNGIKLWKDA